MRRDVCVRVPLCAQSLHTHAARCTKRETTGRCWLPGGRVADVLLRQKSLLQQRRRSFSSAVGGDVTTTNVATIAISGNKQMRFACACEALLASSATQRTRSGHKAPRANMCVCVVTKRNNRGVGGGMRARFNLWRDLRLAHFRGFSHTAKTGRWGVVRTICNHKICVAILYFMHAKREADCRRRATTRRVRFDLTLL